MGFLNFILRGNVVDLAVAFVVGAAFTALVQSLVSDFITPLIAAIGAQPDFSKLYFTLNGSKFLYGHFFNALISFLVICVVVYYLIVVPIEHFFPQRVVTRTCPVRELRQQLPLHRSRHRTCLKECKETIAIDAKKCKFCTAQISAMEQFTTEVKATDDDSRESTKG